MQTQAGIESTLNDRQIYQIARPIAVRLLVLQDGWMDAPDTWERVASKRGHAWEYFHDPHAGPGEWVSCEAGTGCIRVNTAHTPPVMARAAVHELGHAELASLSSGLWRGDVPGFLRGVFALCPPASRMGYDDDPLDVRHRVCRGIERICFNRPGR